MRKQHLFSFLPPPIRRTAPFSPLFHLRALHQISVQNLLETLSDVGIDEVDFVLTSAHFQLLKIRFHGLLIRIAHLPRL